MSFFQLGSVIKMRREELGLSQEELADGICSVPTLSRIENGERMPTKNHFEMLMQRLGYSSTSIDFFTDKQSFLLHDFKYKIRQAYIDKNYDLARKNLEEFCKISNNPSKIDEQFLILYQILLNLQEVTTEEKLMQLEKALVLTCPKYKIGNIPKILSYAEVLLLNNIAICYDCLGKRTQTISILTSLKEHYESQMTNKEEALRTQPMILYNLSKYLGLNGEYDECIKVCDMGIQIARTTGRCSLLAETLFNRSWALIQRNLPEDEDAAKENLRQAKSFCFAFGNEMLLEEIENYCKSVFEDTLL